MEAVCFYISQWEALRVYPPLTIAARSLHKELDVTINGKTVQLPAGSRCMFSLYWIHRCEVNFARPNEYRPERWAQKRDNGQWEERTTDNDLGQVIPIGNAAAHIAFSVGARDCVGRSLATRMVPTMAAALLRRFRVELPPGQEEREITFERYGASQVPIGGIPIILKVR